MTGWEVSLAPISGLERKFTGFTGQRVSVELRFLKASFPEEFGCEKKVSPKNLAVKRKFRWVDWFR